MPASTRTLPRCRYPRRGRSLVAHRFDRLRAPVETARRCIPRCSYRARGSRGSDSLHAVRHSYNTRPQRFSARSEPALRLILAFAPKISRHLTPPRARSEGRTVPYLSERRGNHGILAETKSARCPGPRSHRSCGNGFLPPRGAFPYLPCLPARRTYTLVCSERGGPS